MSVALHPARASASGAARTRLAELFGKTPLLTLERSARHVAQPDDELWQQGPFSAEIIPDLPEISSWQEVTAKLTRRWDKLWPKLPCNRALVCGYYQHVLLQCCLQQLGQNFEQLVHVYDQSSYWCDLCTSTQTTRQCQTCRCTPAPKVPSQQQKGVASRDVRGMQQWYIQTVAAQVNHHDWDVLCCGVCFCDVLRCSPVRPHSRQLQLWQQYNVHQQATAKQC